MAISNRRPGASKVSAEVTPEDKAALDFIAGVGKGQQQSQDEAIPKPAKKVGIMVYFDPEVVKKVDRRAKKEGLSRSAWLHSKAIRALDEE